MDFACDHIQFTVKNFLKSGDCAFVEPSGFVVGAVGLGAVGTIFFVEALLVLSRFAVPRLERSQFFMVLLAHGWLRFDARDGGRFLITAHWQLITIL